jgi:Na+/proline symporter
MAGGVVIGYTFVGGLLADAVTDLLQGITLVVGLVVLFVAFVLAHPEAFDQLSHATEALHATGQAAGAESAGLWEIIETWSIPICGSVVAQELISRISAARSGQIARRAGQWGGAFYILIGLIPLSLGIMGRYFFQDLGEPDQILPLMAQQYLSPALYVVFAGALVSVILSTVDSALLAAGSLVSHNLVVPLFKKPSEKTKLLTARLTVVVLGVLAIVLAFTGDSVYALVEEASAFGTAGVFVIFIFGLLTRVGGSLAAVTALLTGIVCWILGAHVLAWEVPYIKSIGAALVGYLVVAAVERQKSVPGAVEAEAA